jgi:CelD/BcsL family acetyltransferase involved in cellulose biosynthesis
MRQRQTITDRGNARTDQHGSAYDSVPAGMEKGLTVEEISSPEQMSMLEPVWDSLLAQSARPELYLTYEWMSTWWRCFRDESRRLLILLVRDADRPVGIAPLMLTTDRLFGLRVRKVEFLTTMCYANAPTNCAATLDIITVPDRSAEVVRTVMTYLRSREHDWDFLRLHPIPQSSVTAGELSRCAETFGYRSYIAPVFQNAYIYTDRSWEEYRHSLSKNFKKQLRSQERKLAATGPISYELISDPAEIDRAIEEMMNIERRSWKWNIGVSINSTAYRNFYQEFARIAITRGWLNLWLMHLNAEIISYEYVVTFHGQAEVLKGSFDTRYQHFSPGNHLALKEYETYFGNARRIGLLWGGTFGKQRWHPTFEQHSEVFIFNKTIYGQILRGLIMRAYLCTIQRYITDIWHRIARKLHIRLRTSELTREDQIQQ